MLLAVLKMTRSRVQIRKAQVLDSDTRFFFRFAESGTGHRSGFSGRQSGL
jgi:hypothetical protein